MLSLIRHLEIRLTVAKTVVIATCAVQNIFPQKDKENKERKRKRQTVLLFKELGNSPISNS